MILGSGADCPDNVADLEASTLCQGDGSSEGFRRSPLHTSDLPPLMSLHRQGRTTAAT
jgi:hypothetical protein